MTRRARTGEAGATRSRSDSALPAPDSLEAVSREVIACEACPRLRAHCRQVAETRRAAYRDETYWGRPVPSFGDSRARILVVGLAPGAHGANRTGRLFTGDRSGDFLFASLHRCGLANQPASRGVDDGLRLRGLLISAVARCAPPENRPEPEEIRRCRGFLEREILCLSRLRLAVALGRIAFDGLWAALEGLGFEVPKPRPRFAHGAETSAAGGRPFVLASYHPSQQNTQTGRFTAPMCDAIFRRAREVAGLTSP